MQKRFAVSPLITGGGIEIMWNNSLGRCNFLRTYQSYLKTNFAKNHLGFLLYHSFRGVVKKTVFLRLTVRVDPPPPLTVSFCEIFYGVHLTMDYYNMYYEADFRPEIQYVMY